MKHHNPVYVGCNADVKVRAEILRRELERTNNHLSATIDNNEDGSLTFFVLDPNLVEV